MLCVKESFEILLIKIDANVIFPVKVYYKRIKYKIGLICDWIK